MTTKMINSVQFKSVLKGIKSGTNLTPPASDFVLCKTYTDTPESLEGERQVKFTISTDCVDRDNDVINQKGWKLDNFKKNPVVLWSHRSDQPPLGRVVTLGVEDGKLKAVVEFVPADNPYVGAQAEGVFRMCQQGFLSAVSVGFQPIEWEMTEDKARGAESWSPGVDFIRQELFELSICPVPANPEALIEAPASSDRLRSLNNSRSRARHILQLLEIEG